MSRRSEMEAAQVAGARFSTRLGEALRDTGLTALVALGVFLPLVGFQTVTNIRDALALTTRWPLLFALVASITAARARRFALAAAGLANRSELSAQLVYPVRGRLRDRLSDARRARGGIWRL